MSFFSNGIHYDCSMKGKVIVQKDIEIEECKFDSFMTGPLTISP
jgi:hypothetical protein